jgi:methylated-DNA-[protein]-cysteine S-methyltransferase
MDNATMRPASAPREPAITAVFDSPIGPIHAAAIADGIIGLEVRSTDEEFEAGLRRRTGRAAVRRGTGAGAHSRADRRAIAHLAALEGWLAAHFGGRLGRFEFPVVFEGLSEWDWRVLDGVRRLEPGETVGYGELARRIGAPGAARAVGSAVGRNPIGLIVPCHRVIAGDGTLGGYGGSWPGDREALLALKEELLALEGVRVPRRAARS